MSDSPANLFKPFDEIERAIGECFEIVRVERERRRHAENAVRRKDEFLAAVAHELRNALHSTGGWLALLCSGELAETDARRAARAVKRGFKLQTKLVEDLMDASQISSGTFRLDLREIEIAPVIESVVNDFAVLAESKQIKIESFLSQSLKTLTADEDRLAQVLCNLLSNAIKFTPVKGRISVETKRTDCCVEIRVIDNGRGIAAEFLPLIFDAFSQSKPLRNGKQKGLGLGLTIARQIVALHGGNISASSAGCNRGATFTVQLPLNFPAKTEVKNLFWNESENPRFAGVSK